MGRCYQESSRIFLDETEVLHVVSTESVTKEIIFLANQTGLDIDNNDIDNVWQSTVRSWLPKSLWFAMSFTARRCGGDFICRVVLKSATDLFNDNAAVHFQQILTLRQKQTTLDSIFVIEELVMHVGIIQSYFFYFFHFFLCRFLRNCLKDEISLFRPINTSLKIFINIWYIPFNKSWFCNILMCTLCDLELGFLSREFPGRISREILRFFTSRFPGFLVGIPGN